MKGLIILLVILGIGAGLVVWKNNVGGQSNMSFSSISKEEVELLLEDVAEVNPIVLKRFAEDPEMKKKQLESLQQLLAFASQAQKEGLANDPTNKQELKNIRAEVVAVNYDKAMNSDKGPMPPFGFISEDQVKQFWGEGAQPDKGLMDSVKDTLGLGRLNPETAFNKFLDTKVALLKESNPAMKDREISEDERTQARDFFAKVQIYENEFDTKAAAGELDQKLVAKTNLQVKLQQAQFLARLYSDVMAEKVKVTDEEVTKYIADHPEFDTSEKRTRAEEILVRAKNGEDFAVLANEFSEDPGNKGGADGEAQGGLYKDVTKGRMVQPFEEAALALEPGQISPNLVESDYGYHIIKLERKGTENGPDGQPTETYDVRHILITTTYKDPENEMAREQPIKAFVRQKLEEEKQKAALDKLIADNHVSVPEDFDVPEVSDEQIEEMMKQQQMPSLEMPDSAPPTPAANANSK